MSSTAAASRDDGSSAAARYDRREVAGMANFKIYLLRPFCSNRVNFLQDIGDTVAKMIDQDLEFRIM